MLGGDVIKKRRRADEGFTFIEIMVAMIILLILISAVGFGYMRYIGRARITAAKNQIQTFELALNAYYLDCSRFPTAEQGLDALWAKPILEPTPSGWGGPYLTKPVPVDPWKTSYEYQNPGPEGLPFGILSLGADGLHGGDGNDGDLASWVN